MRPRFAISLLILLAAALAIVFWLRPKRSATASTPMSETVQATNQLPSSNANVASQNASHAPMPPNPPLNQQTIVTHKVETPEQARQEIESANVPIEFYGKVIDQDSNALAGAKIDIGIRHWTMPDPTTQLAASDTIHLDKTSDAVGRFEFHGATGDGFGVGITKDGYELEQNKYGSGPTAGSLDNPVVFKMWSTNIHERLISGDKTFHVVPDGRPYFINLTDGTISESSSGDLKVWIKRPEPITARKYDWSCEMDAIKGGILLESDKNAAMYEAPTDGYTNSFSYKEGATANGWGDTTGEQRFYVRLNNGQEYGRISIELEAYYNNQIPGMIRLSYAINPSGSRILR